MALQVTSINTLFSLNWALSCCFLYLSDWKIWRIEMEAGARKVPGPRICSSGLLLILSILSQDSRRMNLRLMVTDPGEDMLRTMEYLSVFVPSVYMFACNSLMNSLALSRFGNGISQSPYTPIWWIEGSQVTLTSFHLIILSSFTDDKNRWLFANYYISYSDINA